jgi:hypothetical protein
MTVRLTPLVQMGTTVRKVFLAWLVLMGTTVRKVHLAPLVQIAVLSLAQAWPLLKVDRSRSGWDRCVGCASGLYSRKL